MTTARMLATLALALGLTACSGDEGKDTEDTDDTDVTAGDDDDDDDDDDDTVVETADTSGGGGDGGFIPAVVIPYANFGFDLATATLIDVEDPTYGTLSPSVLLVVGNDEFAATNDYYATDTWCIVELPLTNPAPAAWATASGLWYGTDYDYYSAPPLSTCNAANGITVDPSWTYGYGEDYLALALAGPWGVGVGEMTPDAAAALAGYPYDYRPPGVFFGGSFNDGLLGYEVPDNLALAHVIDATRTLTGDYVQANVVSPGNGVVTAYYEILPLYSIVFN
jgi:hypothetical protein